MQAETQVFNRTPMVPHRLILNIKAIVATAVFSTFIAFSSAAHAVEVTANFTDFNEKLLGTGGLGVFGTFDFSITNDTTDTWTGFKFQDREPIGIIDESSYSGPGSIFFSDSYYILSGLSVVVGSTLIFSIDENCVGEGCSLGGAIWYGAPIADGEVNPVPLPAALPLFASGLGGLGLLGWWRRRKAAKSAPKALAA